MSSWLNRVVGSDLERVYEGVDAAEDALRWLRRKPRTLAELRAENIDWLRWMAANIEDGELLENLSHDVDADVRMWVACNRMTPESVLWRLAEDRVVFVRRGVAQNRSSPMGLLAKLSDDADYAVRALALWNGEAISLFSRLQMN
jgi:hypothetical protein